MNPQSNQSAAAALPASLELPVFGPEGLSLVLSASRSDADGQTYVAVHSRKNDILLYFGIGWESGEVTFSKCIGGAWLDKIVQRVPLTGDKAEVELAIGTDVITVRINGDRLLDWPFDVLFTEIRSLHSAGSWILESMGSVDAQFPLPEAVLPDIPVERDLATVVQDDLIFDFGMHNGDDTDFYLKKGFRVVSVDANPTLCAIASYRFKEAVETERLTICNVGVAPARGELAFYVNETITEWSSFDRDIASRGHPVIEVKVGTTRPEDFFKAFGVPYYCKIDIEGFDRLVVDAVASLPVKPRYVSFENGALRDFEVLVAAGYKKFQLVEQSVLPDVKLPEPSPEGTSIAHVFPAGSSGPFGKDLDGDWLSVDEMRVLLEEHHRELAARPERGYDWWDVHACFQDS